LNCDAILVTQFALQHLQTAGFAICLSAPSGSVAQSAATHPDKPDKYSTGMLSDSTMASRQNPLLERIAAEFAPRGH
jgi:hypothetical protein